MFCHQTFQVWQKLWVRLISHFRIRNGSSWEKALNIKISLVAGIIKVMNKISKIMIVLTLPNMVLYLFLISTLWALLLLTMMSIRACSSVPGFIINCTQDVKKVCMLLNVPVVDMDTRLSVKVGNWANWPAVGMILSACFKHLKD